MPMLDNLLGEIKVPPPLRGVQDGLDPALDDQIFSPFHAADLLNMRVAFGRWETRFGQARWQSLPGSGNVRLLSNYYSKSGTRIRLAVRGSATAGALYTLKEGTDLVFQAISGATGLGSATEPYFQIEYLQDKGYLTDRSGALKRYDPAAPSQLVSITPVTAPAAAPGVRVTAFAVLEDWTNIGLTWAQDDTSKFEGTDDTAATPAPGGLRTAKLNIKSTSALGKTINENVGEGVPSHTIAFWYQQQKAATNIAFEIGIGAVADFTYPLQASTSGEWWPVFIPIGDIGTLNYKQFKVIRAPGSTLAYVSSLVLPGRLEGQYRWLYTHYDSSTGRESPASPISNSGTPIDVSAIGISNKQETARAFTKSALLSFTSDSGTDATTDQIRIYRSGGVAELTKDSYGKDLWLRVATIKDFSTTLSAGAAVNDDHLTVTSAAGIAAGDCLVIEKGTSGKEEYVHVLSVVGTTVNLGRSFFTDQAADRVKISHSNGSAVQVAYHDNVANETIDVTQSVDLERDGPPSAIRFIRRAPNGRLWAFGYSGNPTGVAISNLPTVDRPHDYETFPDKVDPNTRKSAIQGFRTQIGGDTTDEQIQWGGFYQGEPYAFTKKHLYVFRAQSQLEWGANAIQKVLNIGCINGDTVAEVNGVLYWVSDGPRVVRWAGGQSGPEFLSHPRINSRLYTAPTAYYNQWFGLYHAKRDGNYYLLYFTPSGQTTNTQRLDFLADGEGVWEPQQYSDSSGTVLGLGPAAVRDGQSDSYELYQAATASGAIYQTETGTTDDGAAIAILATSKKFALGQASLQYDRQPICMPTKFWLRLLAGAADTLNLQVVTSGSEYGTISHTYPLDLSGSGEKEIFQRLHRDFRGRYVQFFLTGNVSNRPALREMQMWYLLMRLSRHNG